MSSNFDEDEGRKETFTVHKLFICQYSPFFDAAFNGDFEEGATQELDLPDTDPSAFSILVDWLYTQRVTPIQSDGDENPELTRLIKLWILADRFLIPRLQNETLAAMHALDDEKQSLRSFSWMYAYDNTTEGSPLRRYFAYAVARRLERTKPGPLPAKNFDLVPREMLVDIINDFRRPRGKGKSAMRPLKASDDLRDFYVSEDHNDEASGSQ